MENNCKELLNELLNPKITKTSQFYLFCPTMPAIFVQKLKCLFSWRRIHFHFLKISKHINDT